MQVRFKWLAVASGIAEFNAWNAAQASAELEQYITASWAKCLVQNLG